MASVGTRFITANDIAQHVAVAGAANAPAVVLLHGLGWDHTLWRPEIELLAGLGWRVIAPDLRGMGETDKPEVPYSIDLYASDLLALLDELAIARCALVGFSLGGMISLAAAIREPRRIGAALIACASPVTTPEGAAATEAMLARAAKLGPGRFAEEQAAAIWRGEWARDHAAEVQRFIAWRAAMDQAALRRAFRAAYGVDLRPELAGVTAPVRVIMADGDSFVSIETGRALAASLPNAELSVIEQSGHMVSIERPGEFQSALRHFLERNWPPLEIPARVEAPA